MTAALGCIGSICFAACGIPQAWQCHRQGHARGVNEWFLALWLLGEVCYIVAVLLEFGWVWWMLTNYTINLLVICVIIYYKVRGHEAA
jgi:hypothetical protein